MILTKDGKVLGEDNAILVDSDMGLEENFVIHVLKEIDCNHIKKLVGEFEFDTFPSEAQIMYCIVKAGGTIADVRKRYRISRNGGMPSEW